MLLFAIQISWKHGYKQHTRKINWQRKIVSLASPEEYTNEKLVIWFDLPLFFITKHRNVIYGSQHLYHYFDFIVKKKIYIYLGNYACIDLPNKQKKNKVISTFVCIFYKQMVFVALCFVIWLLEKKDTLNINKMPYYNIRLKLT